MTEPSAPYVQPQAFDANGAPLAPEAFAKEAAAGNAYFKAGSRVYVRLPTGQVGTVDAKDAAAPGVTVLSPEETERAYNQKKYGTGAGNLAKATAAGAARGLTLGASDALLTAAGGDETRRALKGLQEANPISSGVGQVAGMVAPLLLSGGAAAGVEGAEALEGASLLSRAGGVAKGAVRTLGAGNRAISALGEAAETGARALGAGGEGVLASAARLAARGTAEGAAYGAAQQADEDVLNDVPLTAERLLAGAWDGAKAGGVMGAGLGVLGSGLSKAGRAIIGKMADDGTGLEENVGTWAERRAFKQSVGNNGKIFDRASNFGQDMSRPARIGRKLLDAEMPTETGAALRRANELAGDAITRMKSVATAMDDAGVVADSGAVLRAVDDQITKLRETPIGDFQNIADRVEKQIAPFRAKVTPPEGATWQEMPQLKFSELWDMRQKLDKTLNWEVKARGPAQEALRDMVGAFRSEIDSTISRAAADGTAAPDLLGAWKQATEDYGDFALARDGLKELSKRQAKNRWMSPTDYGTGGLAGMMIGLMTGHAGVGALAAPIIGAAHKMIRERGAGVLARIADRAASVAGSVDSAAQVMALVEKPARLAIPAAINIDKQFQHYSAVIAQAQNDPAHFAQRVGNATADIALRFPTVAQEVSKTLMGDLAYLDSVHPQAASRKSNTLTPMAVQVETYAFNQKGNFVEAATALENPIGVFNEIARGELPLAGIDALKARRPALWNNMRKTVIKYTMQREDELPFNRRMLLGMAFDFPSDWSLLNIGSIQQSLVDTTQGQNDPRAAPSKVQPDQGQQTVAPGKF